MQLFKNGCDMAIFRRTVDQSRSSIHASDNWGNKEQTIAVVQPASYEGVNQLLCTFSS